MLLSFYKDKSSYQPKTKFSFLFTSRFSSSQVKLLYPDKGSIYAYNLDDAGISSSDSDEALDDDDKAEKKVRTLRFHLVVGWGC